MDSQYALVLIKLLTVLLPGHAETYNVKVGTESHINVVDSRFLSFTVDPAYLFANNDKFISQECVCMASALKPAFIRIAGPSTAHLTFHNSSITVAGQGTPDAPEPFRTSPERRFRIADIVFPKRSSLTKRASAGQDSLIRRSLSVSDRQWKKFAEWSNETGFDIVFALNNQEKLSSGMWDPNSALSLLSVAAKAKIREVVWQLGYECTNQSIEEYLYDLETLRIMVETFPPGQLSQGGGQSQGVGQSWRVVGGDVTPCLQADSKSDFEDYVTLSDERLDAILLDGNSSSHELAKMSDRDRLRLLHLLSRSSTPLWLSDKATWSQSGASEWLRAADWMASLGHSARNGFAVHFRELLEEEVFQPTLSFYMALLFKNLVGERVLSLDFDAPSERTSLFAHCTSLRRKAIPGAVTLYGANTDDEPARFSLKLSRREEGGDIMQFILGMDAGGNILVNGRPMYYEGDIRPVVKRVRPYKTLLINLPPKSFGFWVLANTKVNACYNNETNEITGGKFIKATEITDSVEEENEESNSIKTKRSADVDKINDDVDFDFVDISEESNDEDDEISNAMKKNIEEFRITHELLEREHFNSKSDKNVEKTRAKRQVDESFNAEYNKKENHISILRKPINFIKVQENKESKFVPALKFKNKEDRENTAKIGLAERISQLNAKINGTRHLRQEKLKKLKQKQLENKVRLSERHLEKYHISKVNNKGKTEKGNQIHGRRRRSIHFDTSKLLNTNELRENEIDVDDIGKLGKILYKITNDINNLPKKIAETKKISEHDANTIENQLTVKTLLSDDDASIKISDKTNNGLFEETYNKVMTILGDFNDSLNKVISALSLL